MDDVFFGDAPRSAWSVVHIPRVFKLSMNAEDEEAYAISLNSRAGPRHPPRDKKGEGAGDAPQSVPLPPEPESDLIFRFPSVSSVPEPLEPEKIWRELKEALEDEDARDARLALLAESRRRAMRAEIITHLRTQPSTSATHVHRKTQKSHVPGARQQRREPVPYRSIVPPSQRSAAGLLRDIRRPPTQNHISPFGVRVHERMPLQSSRPDPEPLPGRPAALDTLRAQGRADIFASRGRITDDASPLVAPPVPWKSFRTRTREENNLNSDRRHGKAGKTVSKKVEGKEMGRTRWWEAARVAIGAVVVGLVVGVLGSLSAIPRVTRVVGNTAGEGADHLMEGLKAIAVANVSAGESELAEASALFSRAEKDLLASTSLAVRLLGYFDPQDRYVSGRKLLDAGQKLSYLGHDAAELALLFQGEGSRERTLTETIEASVPLLQRLSVGLEEVDRLVQDVSLEAVPRDRRTELQELQESVGALSTVVRGFLNSHDVLLGLLGARRDQQYLFVFQNNRELRPSGGFIGSFALLDVSRGKVSKVHVDTIYNPDGQLRDHLIPPEPLKKLTDRWFTRDANWFADFRKSARKIASLFERSGGPTVDGVIAVTPTVLERLLRVTGPIPMPEYDVTVTADNVIDETQRLVTFEYDREKNTPKAFIADLLPEILNRVSQLPRERWGDVVSVLTDSLRDKNILLSLADAEAQAKVVDLHWGGTVDQTDGDYLLRVEANIGGHKTDELIDQSVDYDVAIDSDGTAVATLVTTRHHQGSRAGRPEWDPYTDWHRMPNVIYERTLVPRGSVLLEARGFTREQDVTAPYENTADYRTYAQDPDLAALEEGAVDDPSGTVIGEEEEKTSFGNWIVTQPGETSVTVYRYRLPFAYDVRTLITEPFSYRLLLQQQPGHRPVRVQATVHTPPGFGIAWAGPKESVAIENERKATFTGMVTSDSVWGIVAERL